MKIYKLQGEWPAISGYPASGKFSDKTVAEFWAKKLNCTIVEVEEDYDLFNTDTLLY